MCDLTGSEFNRSRWRRVLLAEWTIGDSADEVLFLSAGNYVSILFH